MTSTVKTYHKISFSNLGRDYNISELKHLVNPRKGFTLEKKKRNKQIGLYELQYNKHVYKTSHTVSPNIERDIAIIHPLHFLSTTEYNLIKTIKPFLISDYNRSAICFTYNTQELTYYNDGTFTTKIIPMSKQKVYISPIHNWRETEYNYTHKINLQSIKDTLSAMINITPILNEIMEKPTLLDTLCRLYYDPNYLQYFSKNPYGYLKILNNTYFYHYFKMLHPTTTYNKKECFIKPTYKYVADTATYTIKRI